MRKDQVGLDQAEQSQESHTDSHTRAAGQAALLTIQPGGGWSPRLS